MSDVRTESLAERWRALVLILLFALTLPVGYVGPLGFAALAGGAGILLIPAIRVSRAAAALAVTLLALAAWAAFSFTWSPAAPELAGVDTYAEVEELTALKLFIQLALLGALATGADGLAPAGARRVGAVLVFTVTLLTLVLFVEALTGAGVYQGIRTAIGDPIRPDLAAKNVAQGLYVATVLFWPAALITLRFEPRAPVLVGGLALLLVVAALMFGAFAPALAVLAGVAAWALVAAAPRIGAIVCAAGAVLATISAPFVLGALQAPAGLPASWTARINIWTFAADRVLERPWLGWGLDASRTFGPAVPLHPHDAALQLWLELGLVGAALGALFWALVFAFAGRAAEDDAPVGAAWAATAVSYFVIGALSFGVWQEWWLALGAMALVAGLVLRRGWPAAPRATGLTEL